VRFLVDAQLPRRLTDTLAEPGHDAIHTLDLPDRNATTDRDVTSAADREDRIIVTKDGDFRDSHLLIGQPRRLLHVATGNITNAALLDLVRSHPAEIERAFERGSYVELTADSFIIHTDRPYQADAGGNTFLEFQRR
jgi:predicted nuclease of predicted toxin-antitoxin system